MDFLVENVIKTSQENKEEYEGLTVGQAKIRVIGVGGYWWNSLWTWKWRFEYGLCTGGLGCRCNSRLFTNNI